jgi:hypothetical protein
MKKLLCAALLLAAASVQAQPIITSWKMNNNGQPASYWKNNGTTPGNPSYTFTVATDSADALKVCYNADTVWVYSRDMTDSMGKWTNPGNPTGQPTVHRFPRTPQAATGTHTISPKVGEIGMLINGIHIYGLGDAFSWNGTSNVSMQQGGAGIWNREVGKGEGISLDNTLGAHPQQQGVYHTHVAPYKLWNRLPATQHSPIVGWAFDGYPIYGPYGYSNPNDASSSVTRMKSGYSLRNITTRTAYPATPGGGVTTSQQGPPVNSTYPIGTYVEDWEWLASNSGDLDEYNGRFCVTPEFPSGTYAYFVTIDAAGTPVFPYYIGVYYKGVVDTKNFPQGPNGNGLSIPSYLANCRYATGSGVGVAGINGGNGQLQIFPNPATDGRIIIAGNGHSFSYVTVVDMQGRRVYAAPLQGTKEHSIQLPAAGIYLVRCEDANGGLAQVRRIIVP